MIPMQITYTEYQRAEQPIADFITHLLLVIKKIASPFVLEYRQWVYALASDRNVGHDFTLPVACTVYAYTITHQGSSPGATGIDNNKAYDVGWTNTPVWIIAIGHA